jgi:hypothetical protein
MGSGRSGHPWRSCRAAQIRPTLLYRGRRRPAGGVHSAHDASESPPPIPLGMSLGGSCMVAMFSAALPTRARPCPPPTLRARLRRPQPERRGDAVRHAKGDAPSCHVASAQTMARLRNAGEGEHVCS